jgi:tetratricopeptide (TPR) repeat protein
VSAGRARRRPVRVAFFLAAALALAGTLAGLVILPLIRSTRLNRPLDEHLSEADEAVALGYLDRAADSIRLAAGAARGEYEHLRVLKRASRLARRTGSFGELAALAEKALAGSPGSARLRVLAAYGLLRSEHPQRAAALWAGRWKQSALKENPGAGTLLAEIALKSDASAQMEEGILPEGVLPVEMDRLLRPQTAEQPETLAVLGRHFQDERLSLDAALLAMRQGERDLAAEIARAQLPPASEPAFLIAYDSGENEEALRRLEAVLDGEPPRPDQAAMMGDLMAWTGDTGAARQVYLRLIRESPSFSWKPYLNLAWISLRGRDEDAARYYRQQAVERFPEERRIHWAMIEDLRHSADTGREAEEEYRRQIKAYLARFPDDLQGNLMALELQGERISSAVYQARLWRLFNRHPADERLCRRIVLHLLAGGDTEGAAAALKQHEQASGESGTLWQHQLRGMVAALQGRLAEAREEFTRYLSRREDWWMYYNRGLVVASDIPVFGDTSTSVSPVASDIPVFGDTSTSPLAGTFGVSPVASALEDLRKAEAMLQSGMRQEVRPVEEPDALAARSKIRTRLAQLLLARGEVDSAIRELRYARELDPDNLKPVLLLKKLEEESEK